MMITIMIIIIIIIIAIVIVSVKAYDVTVPSYSVIPSFMAPIKATYP